jgi:hypothetical protein
MFHALRQRQRLLDLSQRPAGVGWDTGAVLVGVGELLFPAPRRDFAGASIRAAARLLRPPLSSRTARFPRSGWKPRLSPWSLPVSYVVQAMARIRRV